MKTKTKWIRLFGMTLTVLALLGASDCNNNGAKSPQDALTQAFEALEASNVEEWNKLLVHNAREANPYFGTQGMFQFKRAVGVETVRDGKSLGLAPGRVTIPNKDAYGQLITISEVEILRKVSSEDNAPSKRVGLADVGCMKNDEGEVIGCKIQDFFDLSAQ